MTAPRITVLASQHDELQAYFAGADDGHERPAAILFKRIEMSVPGLPSSTRYVAVEVHPFDDVWITGSSSSHVAFKLEPLREFFRRCEERSLVFGFAHSHPTGYPTFSEIDVANEQTLLSAISNRNGRDVELVALLWSGQTWTGRIRSTHDPLLAHDARHVLVPNRPLAVHRRRVDSTGDDEVLLRQVAAFGSAFVNTMRSLRVAIVGAGGTGSAVATTLARSGIVEFVLIDPDTLETSNLNRVRGSTRGQVGENKASALAQYLTGLGLGVTVGIIPDRVDSAEGVDAIASCDVVFGCTDDQIGRELLSLATAAYAQPYIDIGLGGRIDHRISGQPYLRYHFGRISTMLPEAGECLFCQGVVSEPQIRRQYALREDPTMNPAEERERYIVGGQDEAPGVGPFTGTVADFGVTSLYDLISPFRRYPAEIRWDAFTVDFVKLDFQSETPRSDASCPYCGTREFLLMDETFRLNRPALGRRNARE